MASFKFRYETVLEQRRHVEDHRQRELAQLLRGKMIIENQLRRMQQTIRDSKQQVGTGLLGKVDLNAIGRVAEYGTQVAMRGQQIVCQLAELAQRITDSRTRLIEAARRRQALQLLRDKHYQQWRYQQNRREAAELDDMVNQGYARRIMEISR